MSVRSDPSRGPVAVVTAPSTEGQLPGRLLALFTLPAFDRTFLTYLLAFVALLWAALVRGAFFQADLSVFVVLSALAGAATLLSGRHTRVIVWWGVTAGPVIAAILVSAAVNHAGGDAPYALGPVVACVSLGVVGSMAARVSDRRLAQRLVVDVTTVIAVLGWLGVALHRSHWAARLAEGWRATATIGYANVTGLALLIGLLCATGLAVNSGRLADFFRCWILATGLFATQSRSAVLALAIGFGILFFCHRPMANALASSATWGLLAFAGLLPSVQGRSPHALEAVTVAGLAAALVARGRRRPMTTKAAARGAAGFLPVAAVVLVAARLHGRILDGGSDRGRLRLWATSWHQLWSGSLFGRGPHQLAELSRGHLGPLLAHNDPLQYAVYYGPIGLMALAALAWRLAVLLRRSRASVPPELWATAVAAAAALACAMMVDFPLEVPIIPALLALVIGAAIQPGRSVLPRHPERGA